MKKSNLHPHSTYWTSDKVAHFWKELRETSLDAYSFANVMGSVLEELIYEALPPPSNVLDFGSGNGILAQTLRRHGYKVTEYDPGMSGAGNTNSDHNPENLIDIIHYESLRYDLVCCFEVLEHILPDEWDKTLSLIKCSLLPDGIFLGSVPADEVIADSLCLCPECGALFHRFQHQRSFSLNDLTVLFNNMGFKHTYIIWIPPSYYFYASAQRPVPKKLPENWAAIRDKYNSEVKNFAYYKDKVSNFEQLFDQIPRDKLVFLTESCKLSRLGNTILDLLLKVNNYKNNNKLYQKGWMIKEQFIHGKLIGALKHYGLSLKARIEHLRRKLYWDKSWLLKAIHPAPQADNVSWLNYLANNSTHSPVNALDAPLKQHHLVLVTGYLGPGGAERQWCYLARELSARGYRVTLLTTSILEGDGAHYLPLLEGSGVQVVERDRIRVPLDYSPLPSDQIPVDARLLATALDQLRPSHVIAQLDYCNVWSAAAALVQRFPPTSVLMSFRNRNPTNFWFCAPYFHDYYRILCNSPLVVLNANSHSSAKDYAQWIGFDEKRVGVAHNALILPQLSPETRERMRRSLGISESVRLVLGVFRLSPEKNPDLFLEVARAVHEKLPNTIFLHAGIGNHGDSMRQAAEDPEMRNWFRLLGRRDDVSDLMRAADIFLLCSDIEGLPNVLLEAQAAELPIVATRVGGVSDAVQDGTTALLSEARDKDSLVRDCLKLLIDADLRRKMGNAGRRYVGETFTFKALGDAILTQLGLPDIAPEPSLPVENLPRGDTPVSDYYRQLMLEELFQACPDVLSTPLLIFAPFSLSPRFGRLLPPHSLCLTLPGVMQPAEIPSMELDWHDPTSDVLLKGKVYPGSCALVMGDWPWWKNVEGSLKACGVKWLLPLGIDGWYRFPLLSRKLWHDLHGLLCKIKRGILGGISPALQPRCGSKSKGRGED